jgi:ABC-type uncharacterized transport system ATPase subunit
MEKYALEMLDISKKFGEFYANKDITLQVKPGEVHALLGENGAGKSTLMNILFGLYTPTSGSIKIRGQEVKINDPLHANKLRIGMVHQHFKLIDDFTVTENIILGVEPTVGKKVDIKFANKRVDDLSNKYRLFVNGKEKVEKLTVGQQQKVEILKMLYRDAEILIFDEPTAVLTPQEIVEFMEIIKDFAKQGKTVLIITHKLAEIKEIADRCTIIRKGQYIDTVDVKTTSEAELAALMVGREVNFNLDKKEYSQGEVVATLNNVGLQVNKQMKLKDINLKLRAGEILGVAGVEGNGQEELAEILTGMTKPTIGSIYMYDNEMTGKNAREFRAETVAHIPSDRHKHGLVLDMPMSDNMVLNSYYSYPYSKNGLINQNEINDFATKMFEENDVRSANGIKSLARGLSGGNQQKAIIGRELSTDPSIIIASQPTRGVDVGSIENIHKKLLKERENGKSIVLISYELDEIIQLADKIAVIFEGEIVEIREASTITKEEIGEYMAGGRSE